MSARIIPFPNPDEIVDDPVFRLCGLCLAPETCREMRRCVREPLLTDQDEAEPAA